MKVTSWTRLFQKLTSGRRFCSALIKNTRNPTETQGNTGKSDTGGGHSAHHACAPHQLHTHLSTPDQNKKLQNTFFKIQYFCVCFFFVVFVFFLFFLPGEGAWAWVKKHSTSTTQHHLVRPSPTTLCTHAHNHPPMLILPKSPFNIPLPLYLQNLQVRI